MGGSPFFQCLPISDDGPALGHIVATASSLRRSHPYNGFLKDFSDLKQANMLNGTWWGRAFQFNGFKSNEAFSSKFATGLCHFDWGEGSEKASGNEKTSGNEGVSDPKSSRKNVPMRSQETNALIAVNVAAYVADRATYHTLSSWGAKNNYWIRKGQWWRLVTYSFLHAYPWQLLVNCMSLYSVGSCVEAFSGPNRYLAVYFASAVAGSGLSYRFSKLNTAGASGVTFGLLGSYAEYIARHREHLKGDGKEELNDVMLVIGLSAIYGLLVKRLEIYGLLGKLPDNWAHVGGFLGGVAASWLFGPAFKQESQTTAEGKKVFIDRPPIPFLVNPQPQKKSKP